MIETISISEFKATCLKVIDQVKNTGMSIIVTKRGEPYALVTKPPARKKSESWIGKYKNKIKGSVQINCHSKRFSFMPDLVNSIERIRSNSRLFRVIRD